MICSKQWDIQLEIAINGDDKRDYYTTGIIYIYIYLIERIATMGISWEYHGIYDPVVNAIQHMEL